MGGGIYSILTINAVSTNLVRRGLALLPSKSFLSKNIFKENIAGNAAAARFIGIQPDLISNQFEMNKGNFKIFSSQKNFIFTAIYG